jgi:hypothetical protein
MADIEAFSIFSEGLTGLYQTLHDYSTITPAEKANYEALDPSTNDDTIMTTKDNSLVSAITSIEAIDELDAPDTPESSVGQIDQVETDPFVLEFPSHDRSKNFRNEENPDYDFSDDEFYTAEDAARLRAKDAANAKRCVADLSGSTSVLDMKSHQLLIASEVKEMEQSRRPSRKRRRTTAPGKMLTASQEPIIVAMESQVPNGEYGHTRKITRGSHKSIGVSGTNHATEHNKLPQRVRRERHKAKSAVAAPLEVSGELPEDAESGANNASDVPDTDQSNKADALLPQSLNDEGLGARRLTRGVVREVIDLDPSQLDGLFQRLKYPVPKNRRSQGSGRAVLAEGAAADLTDADINPAITSWNKDEKDVDSEPASSSANTGENGRVTRRRVGRPWKQLSTSTGGSTAEHSGQVSPPKWERRSKRFAIGSTAQQAIEIPDSDDDQPSSSPKAPKKGEHLPSSQAVNEHRQESQRLTRGGFKALADFDPNQVVGLFKRLPRNFKIGVK